jgi:hypothetical protein
MLARFALAAVTLSVLLASFVSATPVPTDFEATSLTEEYKRALTASVCARLNLSVAVKERVCTGPLGLNCQETGATLNVAVAQGSVKGILLSVSGELTLVECVSAFKAEFLPLAVSQTSRPQLGLHRVR